MLVPMPFAGILYRTGSFDNPDFPNETYSWDPTGPDLWVDFCYCPGHYRDVISFLKLQCKREIGWTRQKTRTDYRLPIGKLRSHSLFKSG
jgi:hypothetical protein